MIDLRHPMCIQKALAACSRRALPALTLLAPLVLVACNKPSGPPPGPPAGPPPDSVAAAVEKEIVETDEFPGRIEAIDRTFWFGFTDDIVIRVRATDAGSRASVRLPLPPQVEPVKGSSEQTAESPRTSSDEVAR